MQHQGRQAARPASSSAVAAAAAPPPRPRAVAAAAARREKRAAAAAPRAAGGSGSGAGAESFGDAVKRVAKRVQGALPIIGLLSRLASSEGGFDGANAATYAEFSRTVYNSEAAYAPFSVAAAALEKAHGKPAQSRYVLLAAWMAEQGAGGLVAPRDVVAAMRRLRVSGDMEIEIDRFLNSRNATLEKYAMVERSAAPEALRAELGVDAVAAVATGLKDGQALGEDDARHVAAVVGATMRLPAEVVAAAVAGRADRALLPAAPAARAN